MAVSATIAASLKATQTGGNEYDSGGAFRPAIGATLAFTNGTAASQADRLFVDQRTVADGGNDDIDLAGALTDAFGVAFAPAEVVAVMVLNAPISGTANTTTLTVGGAASPVTGFGNAGPAIQPGGVYLVGSSSATGYAVTATSADILRVTNAAGAANTYQIAILARSA